MTCSPIQVIFHLTASCIELAKPTLRPAPRARPLTKQSHITYSTARVMRMNGMVLHRLSAATQSRYGTCWVTGAPIRRSSYTSERREDSRTLTVIFRFFRLRLMLPLPPLPFSHYVTRRRRPRRQDTPTVPSPPTLGGHSPSPLSVPRRHTCAQSLQVPPVISVGSAAGRTPLSRLSVCCLSSMHV